MKTLLIGKGHLGKLLNKELEIQPGYYWTDRMANLDEATLLRLAPDLIVNTAGKTDLTFCENNKDECWQSNVIEPLYLYRRNLKTVKAHYLHISSGCIWDGPFNETGRAFEPLDPPTPACFYSWSKATFDSLLKEEAMAPVAILRPRQVYSASFAGPGETTRNTLQKLMQYKTLIDTPNSMTSAYTIAKAIRNIRAIECWPLIRTYNVYDLGYTTPYEVGRMLAEAGLREMPGLTYKNELDKWHKPRRVDAVIHDAGFEEIVEPPKVEDELRRVIALFKLSAGESKPAAE